MRAARAMTLVKMAMATGPPATAATRVMKGRSTEEAVAEVVEGVAHAHIIRARLFRVNNRALETCGPDQGEHHQRHRIDQERLAHHASEASGPRSGGWPASRRPPRGCSPVAHGPGVPELHPLHPGRT